MHDLSVTAVALFPGPMLRYITDKGTIRAQTVWLQKLPGNPDIHLYGKLFNCAVGCQKEHQKNFG